MLSRITPVILTLDEAPNIGRALAALSWADRVVVLDSGSADATERIVRGHANAVFMQRPFDTHAAQWNHAIHETPIATEWVLALDADYAPPPELIEELRVLDPGAGVAGYRASFRYCIDGRPLRGSLYSPVVVLFRRERAQFVQDGHTQRVVLEGAVRDLRERMLHDDRKPLGRFLASQERYMRREADLIATRPFHVLRWPDRVRKLRCLAPFAVFAHALLARGLLFDGRAGLTYAFQRLCAEAILSLCLLERDRARVSGAPQGLGKP